MNCAFRKKWTNFSASCARKFMNWTFPTSIQWENEKKLAKNKYNVTLLRDIWIFFSEKPTELRTSRYQSDPNWVSIICLTIPAQLDLIDISSIIFCESPNKKFDFILYGFFHDLHILRTAALLKHYIDYIFVWFPIEVIILDLYSLLQISSCHDQNSMKFFYEEISFSSLLKKT